MHKKKKEIVFGPLLRDSRNFRKSFATNKHARVSVSTMYGNDGKENEATTRANLFGEENVGDGGGDGSDGGGVGAPSRRLAEKGEKKEEVVNVEKPRRNPKRRCIDSNRRLSYSTAADLRGTSSLVDVRRYCPAIPPPPFTPAVPYAHKSAPLLP